MYTPKRSVLQEKDKLIRTVQDLCEEFNKPKAITENDIVDGAVSQSKLSSSLISIIEGRENIIVGTLPSSGENNTIYRVPGSDSYTDYAWDGSQFILLATFTGNPIPDATPTEGSTNPVQSGGVWDITSMITELVQPTNLFETGNVGIYYSDGSFRTYASWNYIEVPIVSEGDTFRFYKWYTTGGVAQYVEETHVCVAAYENGVIASSKGQNQTTSYYVVPSGVDSIKISFNISTAPKPLVTKNMETPPSVETPYTEPYLSVKTDKTLTQANKIADAKAVGDKFDSFQNTLSVGTKFVIPKDVYFCMGVGLNMYFENFVIAPSIDNIMIDVGLNSFTLESHVYKDNIAIETNHEATKVAMRFKMFNKTSGELIEDTVYSIMGNSLANTLPSTAKNILVIGDSLTEYGLYLAELERMSGGKFKSIGSRTRTITNPLDNVTYTIRHEGRGGWSTSDYVNLASKSSVTNPFFNPTSESFDFSYYMKNNTTTPDLVLFALGTNDISIADAWNGAASIIQNITEMVTSIRSYSSTLPILVSAITPPAKQDGWGNSSGRTGSASLWAYNQMQMVQAVLQNFEDPTNYIGVLPWYMYLDRNNDFPTGTYPMSFRNTTEVTMQNNNVHPNDIGYYKMSDVLYTYLIRAFS